MILPKDIYSNYFNKKKGEDQFEKQQLEQLLDMDRLELQESIKESIEMAMHTKDGEYLSFLMYSIFSKKDNLYIEEFISYFNQLIIEEWHKEHENIVGLLQRNGGNDESVDNLFKAIFMTFEYLEWDDNYAFAVKCVWAIAVIHGINSEKYLKILAENDNEIISRNAKERLAEY